MYRPIQAATRILINAGLLQPAEAVSITSADQFPLNRLEAARVNIQTGQAHARDRFVREEGELAVTDHLKTSMRATRLLTDIGYAENLVRLSRSYSKIDIESLFVRTLYGFASQEEVNLLGQVFSFDPEVANALMERTLSNLLKKIPNPSPGFDQEDVYAFIQNGLEENEEEQIKTALKASLSEKDYQALVVMKFLMFCMEYGVGEL